MSCKGWIVLFCILLSVSPAAGKTYVSWQGMEADKLASLWLIKNFVDSDAEFKLIPKGQKPEGGIPFDVPTAKFKRSHTLATYEVILQDTGLDDEQLTYIGNIIHDIEINTWETKKIKQTSGVQNDLRKLIDRESDEQKLIQKAMEYFDKLYKSADKQMNRDSSD